MTFVTAGHKECTSGGLNENCYRCSGTGFTGEMVTGLIAECEESLEPQLRCSMCWMRFAESAELEKHFLDIHAMPRSFLPSPRADSIADRDVKVSCCKCRTLQWARQLGRHLMEAHAIPVFSEDLSVELRSQGFVRCELCQATVKRRNVQRHSLKAHGI